MTQPRAFYPGSFDPPTLGHMDLIRRGAAMFGGLVIGVGVNPSKTALLDAADRVRLIESETRDLAGVRVQSFSGLVVQAAKSAGCGILLRGLRTVADFESELQMALTNRDLEPTIETVFMMPNAKFFYVSSRLIKEVFAMGGDASEYLAPAVARAVKERIRGASRP